VVACRDLANDPLSCGLCGNVCGDREACTGGACACRPGLSDCNFTDARSCVNTDSDHDNCSGCGRVCGGDDECDDGACADWDCGGECNNGCVETTNDPLNCGGCAIVCRVNEVCAAGACRTFADAQGCAACPCAVCDGGGRTCCDAPGGASRICVDGADCPALP
jgi:hypothetical protein